MHFNKEQLKIILNALETVQEARQKIAVEHVTSGDFMGVDTAMKNMEKREQLIEAIKEFLKK